MISFMNKKQMRTLQNIQKKALRIIYNTKINAHTSELFNKSRITKIENLFERESLILIHKYKNNSLPLEIQSLIDRSINLSTTNTRSRADFNVAPNRELRSGNFLHDLISIWNKFENMIEGTKKLKDLKNKINEIHNKIKNCTKSDCYTCKEQN